jgi:hypothetical protein
MNNGANQMTDAEFIAREQAKLDKSLVSQLSKVDRTGRIGQKAGEVLLINGLISFGGPRHEINHPYNCYRITDLGREELRRIQNGN